VVTLKEKSLNLQRFKDIIETTGSRTAPEWMEVNLENKSITVKEIPTRDIIDTPVNETLIVELYSK
jgi:small subunit ribosomal protein S4